jgi:hypothetical protein
MYDINAAQKFAERQIFEDEGKSAEGHESPMHKIVHARYVPQAWAGLFLELQKLFGDRHGIFCGIDDIEQALLLLTERAKLGQPEVALSFAEDAKTMAELYAEGLNAEKVQLQFFSERTESIAKTLDNNQCQVMVAYHASKNPDMWFQSRKVFARQVLRNPPGLLIGFNYCVELQPESELMCDHILELIYRRLPFDTALGPPHHHHH